MMKKFGVILATVVLSCGLFACGNNAASNAPDAKTDGEPVVVKNEEDFTSNGIPASVGVLDSNKLVDSYLNVGGTDLVFGTTKLSEIVDKINIDGSSRYMYIIHKDGSTDNLNESKESPLADQIKNFDKNIVSSDEVGMDIVVNREDGSYILWHLSFKCLDKDAGVPLGDTVLYSATLMSDYSEYNESVENANYTGDFKGVPEIRVFNSDTVLGKVKAAELLKLLKQAGYDGELGDELTLVRYEANTPNIGTVQVDYNVAPDGLCHYVSVVKLPSADEIETFDEISAKDNASADKDKTNADATDKDAASTTEGSETVAK